MAHSLSRSYTLEGQYKQVNSYEFRKETLRIL